MIFPSIRHQIHSMLRKEEMQELERARKRLNISPQELLATREDKFRKLIDHAKKNSPYYQRVLNGLSIDKLNDIECIPFLTKEVIKKEYHEIISIPDKAYLKDNSTSGSTGESTHFGTDIRMVSYNSARLNRANEMNGKYRYLDKMVVLWGAERDLLSDWDPRNFYNFHFKKLKIISTYHMTKDDIDDNLKFFNKWKPLLIVGYPSALNFMADYIAENPNILKYFPKAIISAGEMLYETQRENIEKNFNCEVFNRYGSREFVQIAAECGSHSGLHYDAEDLIIEILDEEDKPCPPNVIGNLVITDLNNYAFPMIRYRIGDLASFAEEDRCSCGSTLPKLKELQGRSFDVIRGINGNSVSGSFWTLAFRYKVKGITCFQVRQHAIEEIETRLQVNEAFDESEREKIKKIVQEKLGTETKVKISLVDEFEYTPTGKFKWVVSSTSKKK